MARALVADDRGWVGPHLEQVWGSTEVVSRGRRHDASRLPGFAALQGQELAGLLTYHLEGEELEVVTLDSVRHGIGAGQALMGAVLSVAVAANCRRLWLITTNDNTRALRFYQRWGMDLVGLHYRAVRASRRLKPSIPVTGFDGIPIEHELELEVRLHQERD